MELPSTRELELEVLVRHRDGQLAELNDEITRLRQFVADQPTPSPTDPVTLPPPFMRLLLPHIKNPSKAAEPSSSTVINALTQKVKLLQEENDELYQILRVKETGKLKEEVRSLRKVVHRLEGSLRESHQVIDSLSTELDKTHISLMAASKQIPTAPSHHRTSRSPRPYNAPPVQSQTSTSSANNGTARGLPTGPRSHKKPRLSDPRQSPPPLQHPLPPNPRNTSQAPSQPQRAQQSHHKTHNSSNSSRANESRERKPAGGFPKSSGRSSRMDVDEESNASSRNDKGREREREQHESQQPSSERDRERDSRGNSARDRDDKDRNKERGQKGRDRESGGGGRDNRENKDKVSVNSAHGGGNVGGAKSSAPRRNGAYQGNMGRVASGGGGGGGGHGRRGNSERLSNPQGNGQVDRSLAERMGL